MVSEPWSSTMDSTTNPVQNAFNTATSQSPLMLLNNMSNLMSTKLDSSNYMIWKLQISTVLDAYSVIDHLDGSTSQPSQFLTSETGMQSVNPAFLIWKKKDKAFLTLLYSTLSSPVLAMVVGLSTSQEVWDKLEERFTCTARANVLNLKLELQAIKKGNESVNSYLQRIKTVRDKLSAVGVQSDPEELLHVILKGLPKEYAPFASAIRTRDGVLSLEKLLVLLQTEEQSMQESVDPFSNSALAMFVTPNKPPNGYNGNHGYNNNRGRGGRNSYSRGRGGRSSNFTSNFNTPSFNAPQSNFQQSQSAPQAKSDRPTCQICWKQETWLTDSGASDHISASSTNLSPQVPYHGQEQVSVGNGQQVPIQTIVHKLCLHNNCSCLFDANQLLIQDLPTGKVLYKGLSENGVYPIHSSTFFNSAQNKTACAAQSVSPQKWHLWHSRLGHPSNKVLSSMFPSLQCNSSLTNSVKTHCIHCLAGKMHQLPFPISNKSVSSPFALIHADLWGPAPIMSYTGFRYYLVLVDEFTKFTWTYLLKHKSDTFRVVCQYMSTPTSTHLAAAKRILRYIRGTFNHGIAFTPGSLHLSAYTDADWAGDPDDRRSTSGYIVYLGSNPITWSAKKQPTVSRSSTESEYRALAIASAELCWMRTLLKDLGIFLSHTPILWCDNVSALAIASNPVFHARTKHIEVDFHFVRERVLRKDLLVQFVSTLDQLADIFTKSLPTRRFVELQRNLMVSVPAIEGG
uniref:GAG-pre-integrase domain-containing protein n=1 Tax=Fagus sylvatica TaxID=28930 RepID=A0A2N9HHB5_FAGSY